jgi:hypothetical protein
MLCKFINIFCVLVLYLVLSPIIDAQPCTLRSGLGLRKCSRLAKQGCLVRYLGPGCKVAGMTQGDGGCQPKHTCPFCCESSCNNAKGQDPNCLWSATDNKCFRCWPLGVADNGAPLIPLASAVRPHDWAEDGLGDTFRVFPNCNVRAEFVTGMTLWMAESDPLKSNDPIVDFMSRIVIFYRDGGYRVGEWTGACSVKAMVGKKIAGMYRPRAVQCDFVNRGVLLAPSCGLPALPGGEYDVLFSHDGSKTLAWLQSFQDTGCNSSPCAFSQQMASSVQPRVELCNIRPSLQNLAFQIHGTSIQPTGISSC